MRSLYSGKAGLTGIASASLVLASCFTISSEATAQWLVDADGNWTNTANWTGGIVPGVDGDAVFPNILTDNRTVTLDTSVQLNSISLDTTLNVADYFIVPAASETITLTGAAGISTTSRHWIRAGIAGSAGLNISGGGEIVLDAVNTFSGGMTIDGSNVAIVNDDALPAGNDITISNGGQLRFWGPSNPFFTDNGSAGFSGGTINNNIDLGIAGELHINNDTDATFTGVISGDGLVQVDFNADATFSGANTYTGITQLYDNAITLTGSGTLGAGGSSVNGTNLSFESSVILDGVAVGNEYFLLDENADGQGAKIVSSGNSSISGNIYASEFDDGSYYEFSSAAGGTLTLSGTIGAFDGAAPNDRFLVFSGEGDHVVSRITDDVVDADGNVNSPSTGANVHVVKRGAGTLTVSTATDSISDFWQAGTVVEEGILAVLAGGSNAGELRSATIEVQSGATLDVSSFTTYSLQVTEDPDAIAFNGDEIGQTVSGSGTINTGAGTLSAFEDSVFSPGDNGGDDVGTLSVQGNASMNQTVLNPNGGLNFDLSGDTTAGAGVNDLLDISGDLSLSASGGGQFNVNISLTDNELAAGGAGTYVLIDSTSRSGAATAGNFVVNVFDSNGNDLTGQTRQSASIGLGSSSVDLNVTGSTATQTWAGTVNGDWDVNTTANWSGTDTFYYQLDNVIFDDQGLTNAVNLTTSVSPSSVTLDSATGNTYTFTGTGFGITGNADTSLTGDVSASLANDSLNTLGDVSIAGAATLSVDMTAAELQINGNLSGAGTLNANSAAVVLNGDNSGFTGAMNATNSSIVANTATALSGTVNANAGATIGIYGQTWTNNTPIGLNGGTIRVGGGDVSAVTLSGDISVGAGGGTLQIDGGVGPDGATVNNLLIGANSLTANVGSGSSLNVTAAVSGAGGTLTVSDTGSMVMANGSSLIVSNINVAAGGSLDVSAMNTGAGLTLASGQTLNNDSNTSVNGNVTASSGSTVSGHGTFANNVTVQGGANLQVGLDGMTSFIAAKGLLDNFDGYASGNTSTVASGAWNAEEAIAGDSTIVASDSGNALRAAGTGGGGAWSGAERDLTGSDAAIPVGQTQAFFWQVKAIDVPGGSAEPGGNFYDFMMGLAPDVSNIDSTDAWQDFSAMPFVDNGPADPFIAAVAPTTPFWAPMAEGTVTNVWVVIDNDSVDPTFDVYYSTGTDAPVLVAGDADWRNFAAGLDLNAIGFMSGGNLDSAMEIDNIWYSEDPSDFLTNPLVSAWTGNIAAYDNETLTVEGDLVLEAGALVSLDIATDGINDLLNVTGALTAAGTLEVTLDSSVTALAEGDAFDIFDFGSALGSFDTLDLPALDSGLTWDTSGLLIDGILEVIADAGLVGDLNNDGFVGIADLNLVLGNWNQNVTPGDPLQGDPSGDGFVGIVDLNLVLGNWNAGTPPTASVPEPASLALLGLGGLMLMRRR